MKKFFLNAIVILSCFLLLFAIGGGFNKEETAKIYSCSEYSVDCELQKDNILVKPVKFDKNLVDAYGDPIDSTRWYINNIHTKILAPVCNHQKFNGSGGGDEVEYDDTTYYKGTKPELINHIILRIPGLEKAVIILTGSNEIRPGVGLNSANLVYK